MELRSQCGESGPPSGSLECPSICFWRPGADVVELCQAKSRVWVADLDDELTPEQVETTEPGPEMSLLSPDEQEGASRFIRARWSCRRFARCRAARRTILGGLLEQPPSSLKFRAAVRANRSWIAPAPTIITPANNWIFGSTFRIRPSWR